MGPPGWVRFVDDWEEMPVDAAVHIEEEVEWATGVEEDVELEKPGDAKQPAAEEPQEPDWLVLEKKLRQKYTDSNKDRERLEMEKKTKLPL
jgi:hypothetical protein